MVNAADIMRTIRNKLLQPRRQLSFTFNGIELIPTNDPNVTPGVVDAKNGPQPQKCVITQLTSTTFLITYHIVAHYWDRDSGLSGTTTGTTGNAILFNRWTETIDIDSRNFSKRTREGKFAIRSDNNQGKIADLFRSQMAIVGVPLGWTRESSQYKVTPDGLAIQYRVVDKENYKLPPFPAFEADGEYIESTSMMGVLRHCEVRVHLKGDKSDNRTQAQLLATAVAVATSKLEINGAPITGPGSLARIEGGSIMCKLYDNEVEVRFRALKTVRTKDPATKRLAGIAGFDYAAMTYTPLSEQNEIEALPVFKDRGSAGVVLTAAAYFDPSLQNQFLNRQDGQLSDGTEIGLAGKYPEIET